MRIHNLYEDEAGESHFRDIEVEWADETPAGRITARWPASGIMVRELSAAYDLDWHPAPRRQYIVMLNGRVQITASDGEVRVIGPGEVILVEDTAGKGHRSKNVDARAHQCVWVPADETHITRTSERG